MLGQFRNEVGHYYEWILVEQTGWINKCRERFGDGRHPGRVVSVRCIWGAGT